MRTKIEIQKEIDKLKKELGQIIDEGDLVYVKPTKEWKKTLGYSYAAILRVNHVTSSGISGTAIYINDTTGLKLETSYTFDKNVFIKITI